LKTYTAFLKKLFIKHKKQKLVGYINMQVNKSGNCKMITPPELIEDNNPPINWGLVAVLVS
jgi:hypothetical protein